MGGEYADREPRGAQGVLVVVTDHAAERFRQRVAARRGGLDPRPEIAARVSEAWAAGRVRDTPGAGPGDRGQPAPRPAGTVFVSDLVDRGLLFVCRHDRRGCELVVVTLWENERLGPARVPRRYTDALGPGCCGWTGSPPAMGYWPRCLDSAPSSPRS